MRKILLLLLLFVHTITAYTQTATIPPIKSYEGERNKEGLPNGKGKAFFDDKNWVSYEGEWVNGIPEKYGHFIYSFGNEYIGEVKDGLMHGKGKYNIKDGTIYEGIYETGLPVKGKLKYSNGNYYEGEWTDGKRTGIGYFRWGNGDYYEGSFKEGTRFGFGKYTYANGDVKYGFFFYDENKKEYSMVKEDPFPEDFSNVPINEFVIQKENPIQIRKIQFGKRSAKITMPNGTVLIMYRINDDEYYGAGSTENLYQYMRRSKDDEKEDVVYFFNTRKNGMFSSTSNSELIRYNMPYRDTPIKEFAKYGIEFKYTFKFGKVGQGWVPAKYGYYNAGKTYKIGDLEIQEKDYRQRLEREGHSIDLQGESYVYQIVNPTHKLYKINYSISGHGDFQFYQNPGFLRFEGLRTSWNHYSYSSFVILKPEGVFRDEMVIGSQSNDFLFKVDTITEISNDWYNNLLKALEGSDLNLINKYLSDDLAKEWHSSLKDNKNQIIAKNKKDFNSKYLPLIKTTISPKDKLRFDRDFESEIIYTITNNSDKVLIITYDINDKIKDKIKLNSKESFNNTKKILGIEASSLKVNVKDVSPE
ncbi:MAG: hypothetical protein Q3983_00250 [Capnocytophaga sp.]|nr:hypothetical protein [Capnocytophaga sp.]